MVKCEFCLNYNGISCIEPLGVKYKQPITEPFEEIDCPAYLEKGVAGLAGMKGF
ncbi:MAG: hypothetical protein J7J34_06485 [Thermoplasmata archaeon]|nr:hypothetical protein [Thermoplasmata archaeon]